MGIGYRELLLLLGMLFFSGVQLFSLGLVAEYVGHIHFQVRKRPMVIERGRLNFEDTPASIAPATRAA